MTTAEFDKNGFCISSAEALSEEAFSAFDQESQAALNFHQLERNAYGAGPREWREHKSGLVNYQSRHVPYYYAGLRERYPLRQVFSQAFLGQLYELKLIQSGVESLSTQVQYTYTLNPKDDKAKPPFNEVKWPEVDTQNLHFDSGGVQGGVYRLDCLIGVCLEGADAPSAGNFLVWPQSHKRLREELETSWKPIPEGMGNTDKLVAYNKWKTEAVYHRGVNYGEPDEVPNRRRHAAICHHMLLHGTAKNTTDVTRRMVFFRLGLRTLTGRADAILHPFPVGKNLWRDPLE